MSSCQTHIITVYRQLFISSLIFPPTTWRSNLRLGVCQNREHLPYLHLPTTSSSTFSHPGQTSTCVTNIDGSVTNGARDREDD